MIVWLALVLNYFGQGALLINQPRPSSNPFYLLAPSWLLPLRDRTGDLRHGDRFAGGDLGCVLDNAASVEPGLSATPAQSNIPRKKKSARCMCRR